MRRFRLLRLSDASGVSGTGIVAEGIVFSDGACALRWLSETPSTILYGNDCKDGMLGFDAMIAVHGHSGATQVLWLDD